MAMIFTVVMHYAVVGDCEMRRKRGRGSRETVMIGMQYYTFCVAFTHKEVFLDQSGKALAL